MAGPSNTVVLYGTCNGHQSRRIPSILALSFLMRRGLTARWRSIAIAVAVSTPWLGINLCERIVLYMTYILAVY
ncbi:hypothetical protein BJX63DRAFT_417004 [Aspergillus granulosus]|uniref:Uncharacterized protein n=1 Tax=Aspergillus granulosus TaxID=176169 RepID=A0ABR4GRE2_9EURO